MADTDSDLDGKPDCNDAFPVDPDESLDTDGDEIGNNADPDDDNDGLTDEAEQGPTNDDLNYDGNNDGIADHLQDNVVSLHSYDNQKYLTLETPAGHTLSNCQVTDIPSPSDAPDNIDFDYGVFGFTINGINPGGSTTLTIYLQPGADPDSYYKYGKTLANQTDHWYEFLYDNETGAEINNNIITLHFTDALRGDNVFTQDSMIIDPGAPSFDPTNVGGTGGNNGGGCFIEALSHYF